MSLSPIKSEELENYVIDPSLTKKNEDGTVEFYAKLVLSKEECEAQCQALKNRKASLEEASSQAAANLASQIAAISASLAVIEA